MSRFARKNLSDLFTDMGVDKVTMPLANFWDVDDRGQTVDRAVVAFVNEEKEVSYTGAAILTAEDQKALKEHCRTAWQDANPMVTLSKKEEGALPELTAELPVSGEGTADEPKEEEKTEAEGQAAA